MASMRKCMGFACFFFVVCIVAPVTIPKVDAQISIPIIPSVPLPGIPNIPRTIIVNANGTVFCTLNGSSIGVNGSGTPPFPNATVQLRCGSGNNIISTGTTNANGTFALTADVSQLPLTTILTGCRLVVPTSLSNCNASLPNVTTLVGNLTSLVPNVTFTPPSTLIISFNPTF